MEHHFNIEAAKQYGVNEAIFIQHIKFWTMQNLANRRNIRLGFCWTYNTLDAFTELFPYWNRRQIEHLINKLIDAGAIAKTNLNSKKYDRTCWYALTAKVFSLYPDLSTPLYVNLLIDSHETDKNLVDENGKLLISLISQKCEMDFTKLGNGFHKNVTPIPDSNPDSNQQIKSSCNIGQKKIKSKSREAIKQENEKKHDWATKAKASPLADVTNQSTSYERSTKKQPPTSPEAVRVAMMALPRGLRPRRYRNVERGVSQENS